jgi:hypothetical protein
MLSNPPSVTNATQATKRLSIYLVIVNEDSYHKGFLDLAERRRRIAYCSAVIVEEVGVAGLRVIYTRWKFEINSMSA